MLALTAGLSHEPAWVILIGLLGPTIITLFGTYLRDRRETENESTERAFRESLTERQVLNQEFEASLKRSRDDLADERSRNIAAEARLRDLVKEAEQREVETRTRCEERLHDLQRRCDRWEWLARWWCSESHEQRHRRADAITVANHYLERDNKAIFQAIPSLPGLEDPQPRQ